MNTQDFTKGVDFTGINPATGGDHNNLIELAVPEADTGPEVGKGLTITTTDSALDTPDVPDAATNTKWKRYPWYRRPHATATDTKGHSYIWNDAAVNNSTFLKWVEVTADLSDLTALANNALSTAENAVATADAANTTANAATTTANAASATATAAQTVATAAQTTADTANAAAAVAQTTANAAKAEADSLNTKQLSLETAGNYALYTIETANGVGGGNAAAGQNVRNLINQYSSITNTWATLVAGAIVLDAGTYIFDFYSTGNNAAASGTHKAFLIDTLNSNAVVAQGSSENFLAGAGSGSNTKSIGKGYYTSAANMNIQLQHWFSGAVTAGLGKATSIAGMPVTTEVYAMVAITKLS